MLFSLFALSVKLLRPLLPLVLLLFASGGSASAQTPARASSPADSVTLKLLPGPTPAGGNGEPSVVSFGLATQHAFIGAHTPKVAHLAGSHPSGFDARAEWQTRGARPWHAAWRLPKTGVQLSYFDYHQPILGRSWALSLYTTKFIYRSARQQVHFRTGLGLAYFTNPFSEATNRKNTIVSTHLNAAINFRFEYAHRLTEHLDGEVAVALQHYSNGATSKPNFGINLPTFSAGLVYRPTRYTPPHGPRQLAPLPTGQRRWFVDVATSVGWRQWGVYDRKRYLVNGVHAQVGRRVNLKNNLVAGLDYFYDRSLLVQREQDSTIKGGTPTSDVRKVGVVAGQELLLGRLIVDWHFAWYLYQPFKSGTPYYERIGVKYLITPHLFACVDLKAHRGAADVVEWKLGVRW